MSDFPIQNITIYHKNETQWDRYVKSASYRNTTNLNHSKNGSHSSDNALIRVFDLEGYNTTWFVQKEDIIVKQEVNDKIEGNTPNTQLSKKYGKEKVHTVTSISEFIFEDPEISELNHVKLGCI